ncbi:ankyrin repeat-containing domain protein [Trichophaea hybrida]|nr:ankyrin repeat-containing domain protein [Trichophaea hybrida]
MFFTSERTMPHHTTLDHLSVELIHLIAESLDTTSLNYLHQTTSYLHVALTRRLYDQAASHQTLFTITLPICPSYPVITTYSLFGSPLHYSAFVGNHHAITKLLELGGIDVNLTLKGITPLFCAVIKGHVKCTGLLMANGANDENQWDFSDVPCSALDMAAVYCHEPVFVELLRHNPTWKSSFHHVMNGISPIEYRPPRFKPNPHSLFIEVNDDDAEDTPEKIAAADTRFRMAITLLDHGFPIEIRCDEGHTPLQCSLLRSFPTHDIRRHISPADRTLSSRVIEELLSRGADANAGDYFWQSDGQTPLHQTVATSDFGFASLLLRGGANPTLEDDNDGTPFDDGQPSVGSIRKP